jgi:hypothetical protein
MRSSHNTSIPWRTIGMALALASALGCGGGFYMVDAADDATAVPRSAPSRLNAVQTVRPSDAASSPIEAPESDDSVEMPNYDEDGAIFLLPPGNRQRDYDKWFAALEKVDQRKVKARCAKEPADLLDICKGIGPLVIPAPPEESELRADWQKALSPPQRRYVASKCASARFAVSELCGGRPTLPEESGFAVWYKGLKTAEKVWVDRRCEASDPVMYSRYCGGIGPLRIPVPPVCPGLEQAVAAMMPERTVKVSEPTPQEIQKNQEEKKQQELACEAWSASITPKQNRYIEKYCSIDAPFDARIESESYHFDGSSDLCGISTPLVVKFSEAPVAYSASPAACDRSLVDPNCTAFQFSPGQPLRTDWPTAATPWIALDRNHNGIIDDGSELFGSNTVLPNGTIAKDGYQAIEAVDANSDGKIDSADPTMAALLLWTDLNGNRRSEADELSPLSDIITSIPLQVAAHKRCDKRGNCEIGRLSIKYRGDGCRFKQSTIEQPSSKFQRGSIVDVVLRILPAKRKERSHRTKTST